jgi:hypothetical protein
MRRKAQQRVALQSPINKATPLRLSGNLRQAVQVTGSDVGVVKGRNAERRVPGYTLFRSITRQLGGDSGETAWKAALVEIEDALVPALIIEELDDGSFTVFVPSVPTPMAGAVYILAAKRVHPLDVPFTHVLKVISRWGSGSKDLVAAMERRGTPSVRMR